MSLERERMWDLDEIADICIGRSPVRSGASSLHVLTKYGSSLFRVVRIGYEVTRWAHPEAGDIYRNFLQRHGFVDDKRQVTQRARDAMNYVEVKLALLNAEVQ